VWVKLSGPMRCSPGDYPYAEVAPLARALVRHAPERLVWGSDWPHVNMDGRAMPNDGDLVDLIPEWIPDDLVCVLPPAHSPRSLTANRIAKSKG
jgi:predicted TIM-barrel fold metal-dependent hydrolase